MKINFVGINDARDPFFARTTHARINDLEYVKREQGDSFNGVMRVYGGPAKSRLVPEDWLTRGYGYKTLRVAPGVDEKKLMSTKNLRRSSNEERSSAWKQVWTKHMYHVLLHKYWSGKRRGEFSETQELCLRMRNVPPKL